MRQRVVNEYESDLFSVVDTGCMWLPKHAFGGKIIGIIYVLEVSICGVPAWSISLQFRFLSLST